MPEILLQCFPELKFSLSKKRLFYSRSNKKPVLKVGTGHDSAREKARLYSEQRYGSSCMR